MRLTFRPLTPELWPALEDLFGQNGACNGCWCMYWRIGSAYRRRPREENKRAFREVVERGPPPGLLAFEGEVAVGWCQLTPRDALPWLERTWRLRRVDDVPVWSLSCLYVRKGWRRRGLTSALIAAALQAARRAGAPALEAYPFDADVSPSASGTGYASTFARAGFETVARRAPPRPIMRHDLQAIPNEAPSDPGAGTFQARAVRHAIAAAGIRIRAFHRIEFVWGAQACVTPGAPAPRRGRRLPRSHGPTRTKS